MSKSKKERAQVGPDEYEIDERVDCYRGIPTILNSELAALKKCVVL